MSDTDVFDSILNLEEQYYAEGHALGVTDGAASGKIEGRVFGLEKGFEKLVQLGRLQGKALVWSSRLSSDDLTQTRNDTQQQVHRLRGSERLKKHVARLSSLTDPDEFTTENTEEAVSEIDARLKDALAKTRLIARIVGEEDADADISGDFSSVVNAASKDAIRIRPRSDVNQGRSDEMEDFSGLPRPQS